MAPGLEYEKDSEWGGYYASKRALIPQGYCASNEIICRTSIIQWQIITIRILAEWQESMTWSRFVFSVKEVQSARTQPKNTRLDDHKGNILWTHSNKKQCRDFNGVIICSIQKVIYFRLKGFGNYIKAGRRNKITHLPARDILLIL